MSFVIVGGHDRMHRKYKVIGKKLGHRIKVFTHLPPQFGKCIGCPDGILLFTSTVSHKLVNAAVKEAKRKNIPLVRSHSSSGTALDKSLVELTNLANTI